MSGKAVLISSLALEDLQETVVRLGAQRDELLAQNKRLLDDIERWNATIAAGRERAEQMEAVIRAARNLDARKDEGYATLVSYLIRLHEALATYDANRTPWPEPFDRPKKY
jgi:hypothetical protein